MPNGKIKLELFKNFKLIKGNFPKFLTRKNPINMCGMYHHWKVNTNVGGGSPKA
jgi:hypothetical protein